MKTNLVRCMTMMAIAFGVSSAAANSIDVDLGDSSGAHLTIYDNDQTDQVLFSFTNDGRSGSLTAIYIDDKGLFTKIDNVFESAGVSFTKGGELSNLPEGAPSGFSSDFMVRADKNTTNGVDRGEFLGVVFNLNPGVTLETISNKPPVIVTQFGPNTNGSPNGLPDLTPGTNPVPEPTSLILFGIGTAGLAGLSKRRRNKK